MMRRLIILAIAMAFWAGPTTLTAHERFRIVGTVTRHSADEIEVKTRGDKKMTVGVDEKTVFTRDKKTVSSAAVKVGASVVIDALGDDEDDMVAQEVRLVPTIPGPAAK